MSKCRSMWECVGGKECGGMPGCVDACGSMWVWVAVCVCGCVCVIVGDGGMWV